MGDGLRDEVAPGFEIFVVAVAETTAWAIGDHGALSDGDAVDVNG